MSKKTFNGFIARNSDGALRLFLNRPVRGWSAPRFRGSLELSIEAFEELRWEDEPVAVTLTIES